MKVSNKQIAKWQKQDMLKHNGHAVNNLELEQDRAWQRLKKKLEKPETLAVFKRMKDR